MYSLPSLGVHHAPLQLLLHPPEMFPCSFLPLCKSFGAGSLLIWEPDALLCPRMVGSCWGQWRPEGGFAPHLRYGEVSSKGSE